MSAAPHIDFSYTVFWTKQARAWDAARRAAVREAVRAVMVGPDFLLNAYERRYIVPGLDAQQHSGASLAALEKVLQAFVDDRPQTIDEAADGAPSA
ncbi:MAG: hypothetical protein ACT4QE_25775 [Anaerolineales bacterium]